MYNTKFFKETYALKQKIVSGQLTTDDASMISETFSDHMSKTPHVFNIETTNYCNMTCVMCQRTADLQRPLRHMDLKTYKAVVDSMQPVSDEEMNDWQAFVNNHLRKDRAPSENNFYYDVISKCVTLHGFGAPLLDPLLPERVEMLTRKKIPSYFSETPANIRLDLIKNLFDAGVAYIKFAVDSLDDDCTKEIRGKQADFTKSYQKILEVLALKEKMKAKTTIVVTMLDFYGDYSPQSEPYRFLKLWEGRDVYVFVKTVDNKWLLDQKGAAQKAQGENQNHYSKQYCEFPWTSVTILVDGSVVPCTQDVNGEWTFGNVNEEPLEKIWQSEKFKEFRKMHITGEFPADFMCHTKCDLNRVSQFLNGVLVK